MALASPLLLLWGRDVPPAVTVGGTAPAGVSQTPERRKAPVGAAKSGTTTQWAMLASLFLWLAAMQSRAHKEERFLYAVYPLLCFAAAISVGAVWRMCVGEQM